MELLFLGTGAADWPLKKSADMRDFRRMSSLLVNGDLLIDPGPQVLEALSEFGKDATKIKYVINTHKHPDHFCEQTLSHIMCAGASFFELSAGETIKCGRYEISAYSANHPTCDAAVHFIVSDGEKSFFYGLDGAWLLNDEVNAIKAIKPDLTILDATVGFRKGDYRVFEHNNLNMVIEIKNSLRKYVGRFCISHMAKTLHTCHKTLAGRMKKENIITAYDGLVLEI